MTLPFLLKADLDDRVRARRLRVHCRLCYGLLEVVTGV